MRIAWAALRIVFAIAIAAAIGFQLAETVSKATADGRSEALVIANFFSYFTIESNGLAVVVLLIGAVLLIRRNGDDPQWFATLRLCMTTYMVVTGIVYNLLLRNVEVTAGAEAIPWSNEVLHLIGPLYLALDWLFAPGRIPLQYWRGIRVVVIFPIVWAVYTLIRGPITPNQLTGADYWYPYPFLDPHTSLNGYFSVSFYVILIAAIIGLVAAAAIWVTRRRLPKA
jgi:carbon starvation protein CstA